MGANRLGSFHSCFEMLLMKNLFRGFTSDTLGILYSLWIIARGDTCSDCTFRNVTFMVLFRSSSKLSCLLCKLDKFSSLLVMENQFGSFFLPDIWGILNRFLTLWRLCSFEDLILNGSDSSSLSSIRAIWEWFLRFDPPGNKWSLIFISDLRWLLLCILLFLVIDRVFTLLYRLWELTSL